MPYIASLAYPVPSVTVGKLSKEAALSALHIDAQPMNNHNRGGCLLRSALPEPLRLLHATATNPESSCCGISEFILPQSPVRQNSPYAVNVLPHRLSLASWEQSFQDTFSEAPLGDTRAAQLSITASPLPQPTARPEPRPLVHGVAPPNVALGLSDHERAKSSIRRVSKPKGSCPPLEKKNIVHINSCRDALLSWDGRTPTHLITLHHKSRTTTCTSWQPYETGQLVMVEGDGGVDIGTVASCITIPSPSSKRSAATKFAALPKLRLLREVTLAERDHYTHFLGHVEQGLLQFLRNLSDEARAGTTMEDPVHVPYWDEIPYMNFVDCELQADLRKMYIYYRSPRRVRFLPLAEVLFGYYGCRIWFHQIDRDTPQSSANTSTETTPAMAGLVQ